MRVTEPIREEHQELLPEIEKLRSTAASIGQLPDTGILKLIEEHISFLRHHLIPHAQAEDEVLYPTIAEVMGAPEATRTMSRDHEAVIRLTKRLDELRTDYDADRAREVLYGLYALIRVHFEKEEEIYLTLLDDRLSASQAAEMYHRLEKSGHHTH